jgi:uncharacterized protein (UPF0210 family)
MTRTEDVLATIRMLQEENLDVRAVTLGVSLWGCASRNPQQLCVRIRQKICASARKLRDACEATSARYGIPIVNRRIAVTPIGLIADGHEPSIYMQIAQTLDEAAAEVGADLVGGFTALAQKGMTPGERGLIESLPDVLSGTERVCASVNAASTAAGINVDVVLLVSEMLKKTAERTADRDGFGCAKFVIFANAPEDNPFMAGAFLGTGEADCVINIGVSGPGVVRNALQRALELNPKLTLHDISEVIKTTAFRVTRIGELAGNEIARQVGAEFGIVDLSLAPSPRVGDSIGEILEVMGLGTIGAPGSTAALALLNDAVKKGGLFASSSVGGLSGAFIPVSEDTALARAVQQGSLSLEKLEAMTSVCSVGLDMVALPGDTDAQTLAAIIADELAIGVMNHKTTACRLIPVPGKKAGDIARYGGLFGETVIAPVREAGRSAAFISRGGRIPAPLTSLRN